MLGAGERVQLDAVGVLQGASVQGPVQGASEKAASVQAATQDQSCRLQTHDQREKIDLEAVLPPKDLRAEQSALGKEIVHLVPGLLVTESVSLRLPV